MAIPKQLQPYYEKSSSRLKQSVPFSRTTTNTQPASSISSYCSNISEGSSQPPQLKIPVGDGPYVRAKQIQLIEKDPERAIALFWAAINAGDRVDSALKDMAVVMRQQDRGEEAIQAILSFRHLCSPLAQESLDNVLLDLYKKCGRLDDQIALLKHKLTLIHKGMVFNGKRTKTARSQGRKFQLSIRQEATRLLGNLGWAYMQLCNYMAAEAVYRKALAIEADNNKLCNLGVCLWKQGKKEDARSVLERVTPVSPDGRLDSESHVKSFQRSQALLRDLSSSNSCSAVGHSLIASSHDNSKHQDQPQEFDLWTHWKLWEAPAMTINDHNTTSNLALAISSNPTIIDDINTNPTHISDSSTYPVPISSSYPARVSSNPALLSSRFTKDGPFHKPLLTVASMQDDVDPAITCRRSAGCTSSTSSRQYVSESASFKREIGPDLQQSNVKAKKDTQQSHIEKSVGVASVLHHASTDNYSIKNIDAMCSWLQSSREYWQKPVSRRLIRDGEGSDGKSMHEQGTESLLIEHPLIEHQCSRGEDSSNSINCDIHDKSSLCNRNPSVGTSSDTSALDFSCVDKVLESVVPYVLSWASPTPLNMRNVQDASNLEGPAIRMTSTVKACATDTLEHSNDHDDHMYITFKHSQYLGAWPDTPISQECATRAHQHRLRVFQGMTPPAYTI